VLVPDPDREQLETTVGRARRRVRQNQYLQESAWGAAIALAGVTLALATGQGGFVWWVSAVFASAGAGFAGWRLAARRPTSYGVSQLIDRRLHTHDQISTGVYFLDKTEQTAREQRAMAAAVSASAPIEQAFPLVAPRSLYALGAMVVVASSVAALRLWLDRPPLPGQPLARVLSQMVRPNPAAAKHEAPPDKAGLKAEAPALGYENPEALLNAEREGPPDPSKPAAAEPEGGRPSDGSPAEGPASGDPMGDPANSNLDDLPIQSYEDMMDRDARDGMSKAEGKQGSEQEGSGKNPAASDSESNSLLAKLREAMNNMLSKMQKGGSGKQQKPGGAASNAGEPQEGRGEGQSAAGQPQPGGQESSEGEGAESDQPAAGAGNSAKAGAKGSEGGQRGTSAEGAGQQEGDKSLAEALQQEAMGKLTELYGRRAANVTGEVTVEAQAGKQTLRTPLSAKQGPHRDAGGQVSRDEIPLAYQAYIKEYFSKIRQAEKK